MKALNVFAIILAWILSIAMVFMLVASPMTLSALSLLEPEDIVQIVGQVMVEGAEPAAAQPREAYGVQMLSAEAAVTEESAQSDAANGLVQSIQGIVGDEVSPEMLEKVLTSDAMSELLGAYTEDVANAFVGVDGEKQFTSELLVEVVQENLDEIVEIVEESGKVALTDEQKEAFKSQLQTTVEENAEKIVEEIPTPEQVKESVLSSNQELALAFEILAKKDQIKGAIVGMIVVVSLLIFGLRYPRFRGLRWLSTNLFVAGGFNVIICLILGVGSSAIKSATTAIDSGVGGVIEDVIGTVLSQLAKGVILRTVIIFVAAIGLLVGYILLKKFVCKKKANADPVEEEVIPEAVPAFVPAPVEIETESVADTAPQAEEAPVAEIREEVAEAPAENEI